MSNFEYSSYSSSAAPGGGAVGFDAAKAMFAQADTNRDGGIDRNEFQQWASGAGAGLSVGGAGFESSSYDSSGFSSAGGAGGVIGGDAGFGVVGAVSGDAAALVGGGSAYESSYESSSFGGVQGGYDSTAVSQAANYTASTNAAWSRYGAEVTGAGLYVDSNPQIIRRQAPGGVQTYTQNIKVRFLQPPAVPPPGPLIIKEVRPPQPPVPPPLRIRQQAPPLPQPPPLILRERPPPMPAVVASQTIIRKLAAIPVPPRSVIIERIPAAPPRPRDIIIERWVPYGQQAKRKTIVQRAPAAKGYERPRNVIIQYEPVQVRIVRQFQRLGVVQENPQLYVQRYGAALLDAQLLLQQARAAGVIEDISPPAGAVVSSSFSQESSFGLSGGDVVGFSAGDLGGASASFSSGSLETSGGAGFVSGYEGGVMDGVGASGFESSSFSTNVGGGLAGFDASLGGAGFSSSYESSGFSAGGGAGGFDTGAAAFNIADKNKDGSLDAGEFKQFFQGSV